MVVLHGCAVGVCAQASRWCVMDSKPFSKEFRMALVPKIPMVMSTAN